MVAYRNIIRGTGLAALGAALVVATPVLAQESSGDESIVVTAQRSNQTQVVRGGSLGALGEKDAMEVPFAVKSYSETLILNQQPLTLGAVLENDPSVRTSLGFGNASEQFVVRGFPLLGEDIAIDGLYGVTPRQLVSPELYDQVMVLNGASAFLFGAAPGGSALGGTVNLQPKRARDKDINRVTANYLSDAHIGGAFDFGRRLGDDGAFGIRINGAGRWGDIAIDDEYRSSVVVGAGLDWRSDRARLSLDLAFQRAKVEHMRPMVQLQPTVTVVPKAPKADVNYGQDWQYTTLRDIFGIVKFEYDISDDFMFYASGGARDAAERGTYQSIRLINATTGAAFVTGSNIPRNDNNESTQTGIRGKFATGPITHEINIGASHSRYINRNAFEFSASVPNAANANNIYDPRQVVLPPLTSLVSGNLQDPNPANRTRLTSFFASDTLGILDDKIELTLGLRRQSIFFRAYNINTGARTSRYKEHATTPVIGLVIRPSERFSIYANRIEGLAQGPVAPAGTINVGEIFPPFKTKQYEIGGKVALGKFNASVALFQTDRPQALTILNGAGQSEFTVNGQQRNKGIEFSLDGEPVDGLRVIAGLSLTEAKQRRTQGGTTDGRDAIGVPDYTANVNVEWDLGFLPGVTLTGRLIQTGKQAVNLTNTLELPEWTRFDLGARYVVAAGDTPITFRFNVDNVANDNYWSSSLGGYLVQGLPRTFKTSVTVEF
ncbi:TonB-dependent siderophore receptor [Sphingopyxis fribergensis]|uniref:TonB-dependent siderophore receptor n=1 Tax=Sphingopyxis fribergensis TaxID=1515612 RepID=A0A0A7PJH3_9SPHN|nr:TonB-dependent receptor [Sphingopyxis fribergensis]AJA08087.1 TonB-dependent siderophore receptor [Sphingopyxis fribergensis]